MTDIQSVSLKLPQFWADGAKIWFQQAESQFAIRNITAQQTKYHHVVAALPGEIAVKLQDFFENVPEENQYTVLKSRLLKKFSYTDLEKAEMVRSMPGLGDRKPSDLMDAFLTVCPAGQQMSPLFINEFLRRIPGDVRRHLHTFSSEDPRALAHQADLVWFFHSKN